jgi:hypothetical protein
MISALELRQQLAFALDAEGSDHYRDDLDYIPAINGAIKWLTAVISSAYGQDKFSEEFFRDLTNTGVFLTNNNSRVSLNVFPSEVWTILAVYAKPDVEVDTSLPVPLTPDTKQSYYLDNLIHISSVNDCKRLNIEEWAVTKNNPLESGYDGNQICDDLKLYAYLLNSNLIEIRPAIQNGKATIFWVKKPTPITTITDDIEFPSSVFQLLFDKALNYISYKQGDQTNLYSVSSQDIQQLLTLL